LVDRVLAAQRFGWARFLGARGGALWARGGGWGCGGGGIGGCRGGAVELRFPAARAEGGSAPRRLNFLGGLPRLVPARLRGRAGASAAGGPVGAAARAALALFGAGAGRAGGCGRLPLCLRFPGAGLAREAAFRPRWLPAAPRGLPFFARFAGFRPGARRREAGLRAPERLAGRFRGCGGQLPAELLRELRRFAGRGSGGAGRRVERGGSLLPGCDGGARALLLFLFARFLEHPSHGFGRRGPGGGGRPRGCRLDLAGGRSRRAALSPAFPAARQGLLARPAGSRARRAGRRRGRSGLGGFRPLQR